jgi:hypothetical protein
VVCCYWLREGFDLPLFFMLVILIFLGWFLGKKAKLWCEYGKQR